LKEAQTGKKSKIRNDTDWERLRRLSDAEVHTAVESDPDAHPTNEEFWKDAGVVLPRQIG